VSEVVDPTLFRLRAFEADWVEPLKSRFGRSIEADASSESGRGAKLSIVLLFEAQSWIDVGQLMGYFPAAADADDSLGRVQIEGESLERYVEDGESLPFVFEPHESLSHVDPDVGPLSYERELTQALDDLTPERTEFLHMFFFSTDTEWEERLAKVREFAGELHRRPGSIVASDLLDSVAWCLSGPQSQFNRGEILFPADWRSATLRPPNRRHEPRFEFRDDELMEIRADIRAATAWFAEDERTSAEIRLAAEEPRRIRGRYLGAQETSPFVGDE
jgi:hypothetical protein